MTVQINVNFTNSWCVGKKAVCYGDEQFSLSQLPSLAATIFYCSSFSQTLCAFKHRKQIYTCRSFISLTQPIKRSCKKMLDKTLQECECEYQTFSLCHLVFCLFVFPSLWSTIWRAAAERQLRNHKTQSFAGKCTWLRCNCSPPASFYDRTWRF